MNTFVQLLPISCALCVVGHPSVSCPKIVLSVFLAFFELVLLDFKVSISSQPYLPEA